MNQLKSVTVIEALDHFIANVFPNLFTGKTTTDPAYKRIYALVLERKKQLAGKPNRVNDSWIIKTLTAHGGYLPNGEPRYLFEVNTVSHIRE